MGVGEVNKLTMENIYVQSGGGRGGANLRQRVGMGRREKGKCKWKRTGERRSQVLERVEMESKRLSKYRHVLAS